MRLRSFRRHPNLHMRGVLSVYVQKWRRRDPFFRFETKNDGGWPTGRDPAPFFFVGACLRATGTLVSLFALVGLGEKTATGKRRNSF